MSAQVELGFDPLAVPGASVDLPHDYDPLAVPEGFCPYGHGRLKVVDLHGRQQGACRPCGCSWYVEAGRVWGCACTPADHTCGEGRL